MNTDRYFEIAKSYIDVGAQKDKAKFAELVCPNGPKDAAEFFCKVHDDPNTAIIETPESACGVVALGFLSKLLRELKRTELQEPMTLNWRAPLVELAKAHKAYHVDGMPVVGSIIHLQLGNAQHWRTLVADLGRGAFESVEGGAKDAQGFQMIQHVVVRLVSSHVVMDVTSRKPVVEWIDVGALLESLCPAKEEKPVDPPTGTPAS